jgi:hypothetical protein
VKSSEGFRVCQPVLPRGQLGELRVEHFECEASDEPAVLCV